MKKLVYWFEPTIEIAQALDEIKNRFMTFISYDSTADGYLEVEIVCRQEDVRAIQDILAPVV